jgi:hypothetical protein
VKIARWFTNRFFAARRLQNPGALFLRPFAFLAATLFGIAAKNTKHAQKGLPNNPRAACSGQEDREVVFRRPLNSICRSRTNARMISMFTATARSLLSTLESMATPCSVKA